jgi:hypothetical protein
MAKAENGGSSENIVSMALSANESEMKSNGGERRK